MPLPIQKSTAKTVPLPIQKSAAHTVPLSIQKSAAKSFADVDFEISSQVLCRYRSRNRQQNWDAADSEISIKLCRCRFGNR
jgi:hypothetical protein